MGRHQTCGINHISLNQMYQDHDWSWTWSFICNTFTYIVYWLCIFNNYIMWFFFSFFCLVRCARQKRTCCFTLISDHNVVVVAVTYTQHICSYTVAGTRVHKLLHSLIVLLHRSPRQKEENDQISACLDNRENRSDRITEGSSHDLVLEQYIC